MINISAHCSLLLSVWRFITASERTCTACNKGVSYFCSVIIERCCIFLKEHFLLMLRLENSRKHCGDCLFVYCISFFVINVFSAETKQTKTNNNFANAYKSVRCYSHRLLCPAGNQKKKKTKKKKNKKQKKKTKKKKQKKQPYEPQRQKRFGMTTKTQVSLHMIRVFDVCMRKLCILGYPKCTQWWFWSDFANVKADLNLRWACMSEDTFHTYTRFIRIYVSSHCDYQNYII